MFEYSIEQAMSQVPGPVVEACEHCRENHPFEMPEELESAAFDGKLVIFAGAGVSTESRLVYRATFMETIAAQLGYTADNLPGFADVMTRYESKYGRPQLLMRIRERLEYVKSFQSLWRTATRFHHALATAYFLDLIVTTNWDTYFEDIAAATPIVIPEDYAFWDFPGRKVFKLHGSIDNLGSIVATRADYERCYGRLRTGVIGASLKHLLATRRVVFVGYSFGDDDLNRILRYLKKELADTLPRSYVVTPHGYEGKDFPPERVISTDGAYFIQKLKDIAVDRGYMRPDKTIGRTLDLRERVDESHERVGKLDVTKLPAAVFTLAYQDGLQDAFGRIFTFLPSGHYSNPHSTHDVVRTYALIRQGAIRKRNYWEAAYAQGYLNGMVSLDLDDDQAKNLPLYLVWGSDRVLADFNDFMNELERAPELNKTAMAEARRLVKGVPSEGVVLQHPPFLDADSFLAAVKPKRTVA